MVWLFSCHKLQTCGSRGSLNVKKELFLKQILSFRIRYLKQCNNMVPPNATGAIMAGQFRKIVRRFHTREAFSSTTARTTEELGVRSSLIF
jgi:hypothetical protein